MENNYRLLPIRSWLVMMVYAISLMLPVKGLAQAQTPLTLTQPYYECSTGAITLNYTGGDGTPITYIAPGISRSSATSNTGTVEQGIRNDPKPITIQAIQSGQTVSYTFDFNAYCSTNSNLLPPLVIGSIPDITLTVGEFTSFYVNQYFQDRSSGSQLRYRSSIRFTATGLPSNFLLSDLSDAFPSAKIEGSGTSAGTYNVTVTATSFTLAPPNNFASTTFKITVVDQPVVNPPTGGNLTLISPTYNCSTGAITFNTSGGDGTPITYIAPGITRSSAASNTGTVEPGLRNDPKPITIQAIQSGTTVSYTFDFKAYCGNPPSGSTLEMLAPSVSCGTNGYNVGAYLVFNTRGGDGSPITYSIPGVTVYDPTSGNASLFSCLDPNQQLLLQASQSGYMATYSLDVKKFCPSIQYAKPLTINQIPDLPLSVGQSLGAGYSISGYFSDPNFSIVPKYGNQNHYTFTATGLPNGLFYLTEGTEDSQGLIVKFYGTAPSTPGVYTVNITASNGYCGPATSSFKVIVGNPPTNGSLVLTQPTYNCGSGAIHFNTSGGNGTPIEFQAAGITGWTTNPDQFVDLQSRTASDVKPFTLMARQSGQVVTYTWDLKAACGRARIGVEETNANLSLTILGNPAHEQVRVLIQGAEGQAVQLRLTDLGGRLLESRTIERIGIQEEQSFRLDQQSPGMLLLQGVADGQMRTVKIIKQ